MTIMFLKPPQTEILQQPRSNGLQRFLMGSNREVHPPSTKVSLLGLWTMTAYDPIPTPDLGPVTLSEIQCLPLRVLRASVELILVNHVTWLPTSCKTRVRHHLLRTAFLDTPTLLSSRTSTTCSTYRCSTDIYQYLTRLMKNSQRKENHQN